jgi:hypothetical protein
MHRIFLGIRNMDSRMRGSRLVWVSILAEYRYIKSIQGKIRNNAENLYKLKTSGETSVLTKRCNDFFETGGVVSEL